MVDKSTVICYLKSKEKYKLPNFPSSVLWNSKKWRVLIHFSNDKEKRTWNIKQVLLEAGADTKIVDREGRTASDWVRCRSLCPL